MTAVPALQLTVTGFLGIAVGIVAALAPLYILLLKMNGNMATEKDVAKVREEITDLRQKVVENRLRSERNQKHIHDAINYPDDDDDNSFSTDRASDGGRHRTRCRVSPCPFEDDDDDKPHPWRASRWEANGDSE